MSSNNNHNRWVVIICNIIVKRVYLVSYVSMIAAFSRVFFSVLHACVLRLPIRMISLLSWRWFFIKTYSKIVTFLFITSRFYLSLDEVNHACCRRNRPGCRRPNNPFQEGKSLSPLLHILIGHFNWILKCPLSLVIFNWSFS